ncbi:hypothetical protein [uncultured Nitrospira sp.]|uniref:hypothetical protein n=1 Tax=uncultured Nitrospira sp. TaxID=157176 RepID=UPI003140515C
MNKIFEETTGDVKESVQSEMLRCVFGEWPRRAFLKLTHPAIDWPPPCVPSKETRSTECKM